MLEISSYLKPQQIILPQSNTKKQVLTELAATLAETMNFDPQKMVHAVFEREGLMSTGIGQGLAVPHVRLDGLAEAAIAIAVQPSGIEDYESMDSIPVKLVVLIAAPIGQHETYIRLLAKVVDAVKRCELREKVIEAALRGETGPIYDIFSGK